MSEALEEIYSLLIPLGEHRLLVPRANVAEVTGYREPRPYPNAPPWLLGWFDWEGARIPLLSFEAANGGAAPEVANRTRVVLFRTLSNALDVPYFGILTQGFPQLVRVHEKVLDTLDEQPWPDDSPVLCQVRMINQSPLIPHIERLESMLAGAIAAAA